MKKELYKNVEIELEGFRLTYYLLENPDNLSYGVEVKKLSSTNVAESRAVYNICSKKEQIYEFLERIIKGSVTPTTLEDIVIDWVE